MKKFTVYLVMVLLLFQLFGCQKSGKTLEDKGIYGYVWSGDTYYYAVDHRTVP